MTVCGRKWYQEYVNNLTAEDRRHVTEYESHVPYQFGGEAVRYSNLSVDLPVWVAKQKCMMGVEVVDSELLMLISKKAMKSVGMIINFSRDTATLNGVEFALDIYF